MKSAVVELVNELRDHLSCVNCHRFCPSPTPLKCQHFFCKACTENILLVARECPVCHDRVWASELVPNKQINNLLTSIDGLAAALLPPDGITHTDNDKDDDGAIRKLFEEKPADVDSIGTIRATAGDVDGSDAVAAAPHASSRPTSSTVSAGLVEAISAMHKTLLLPDFNRTLCSDEGDLAAHKHQIEQQLRSAQDEIPSQEIDALLENNDLGVERPSPPARRVADEHEEREEHEGEGEITTQDLDLLRRQHLKVIQSLESDGPAMASLAQPLPDTLDEHHHHQQQQHQQRLAASKTGSGVVCSKESSSQAIPAQSKARSGPAPADVSPPASPPAAAVKAANHSLKDSSFPTPDVPRRTRSQLKEVKILTSNLKRREKSQLFASVSLLVFAKASCVSSATHLVCRADVHNRVSRTIKYMNALLQGIWIVSSRWLSASAAAGYWVSEDDYAVKGDVTCSVILAPRPALLEKRALFHGLRFRLLGDFTAPSRTELASLITAAAGRVLVPGDDGGDGGELLLSPPSFAAAAASAAACEDAQRQFGARPLSCVWVLDCISRYRLLDTAPYQHPSRSS